MNKLRAFATILLLIGCSAPQKELMSDFASDFPTTEELTLVTRYDNLELFEPTSFVVKDSLLFVSDPAEGYLVRCFNINTAHELPKFILKGKSNNEMINAWYLSLYGKDSINATGLHPSLIKTYSINSVFGNEKSVSTLKKPDSLSGYSFNKISDNEIFGTGRIKNKNINKYFIATPNELKEFGELNMELFEISSSGLDEYKTDYDWDVIFSVHPSKDKIATATVNGLMLETVNPKNRTVDNYKYYEKTKFQVQKIDKLTLVNPNSTMSSTAIVCNDKNIMIVKRERLSEIERFYGTDSNDFKYELLVFDWNLNPVKRYNLPFNLCLQHFSQDGKYLYLLVKDENSEKHSLIKYSIS